MNAHDEMLDNVAAFALGTLDAGEARAVAAHMRTCDECCAEYDALRPVVSAVGIAGESEAVPSPLLKMRIMKEVRGARIALEALIVCPAVCTGCGLFAARCGPWSGRRATACDDRGSLGRAPRCVRARRRAGCARPALHRAAWLARATGRQGVSDVDAGKRRENSDAVGHVYPGRARQRPGDDPRERSKHRGNRDQCGAGGRLAATDHQADRASSNSAPNLSVYAGSVRWRNGRAGARGPASRRLSVMGNTTVT